MFSLLVTISPMIASQPCLSEVEIICLEIHNENWPHIGDQLTCNVDESIISIFSDSSVSSVVYSNKSEVMKLAEIAALQIQDATEVKLIPSGIKRLFPNLKVLVIHNCDLLSVSKEILKEFGNFLEGLDLPYNKIISIDADLLKYNSNLKGIWLNDNPILHIEPEFFTNLKNLKNIERVDFRSTNCMHYVFDTSYGHNISTFMWKNEKCTDSTARIETQNLISNYKCLHKPSMKTVL